MVCRFDQQVSSSSWSLPPRNGRGGISQLNGANRPRTLFCAPVSLDDSLCFRPSRSASIASEVFTLRRTAGRQLEGQVQAPLRAPSSRENDDEWRATVGPNGLDEHFGLHSSKSAIMPPAAPLLRAHPAPPGRTHSERLLRRPRAGFGLRHLGAWSELNCLPSWPRPAPDGSRADRFLLV